jgi:rhomboid protease GluP
MRIETKFVKNYLSRAPFSKGIESVLIVLGFCLLTSWFYWNPALELSKYLSASYSSVIDKGEYWRLFTTSFVHADLKHLLSNSLMLGFLTYFVASFYGGIVSVILSFVVATITNFIVLKVYGGSITLVGASGVVYYLWGFWMILYMFLQRQHSLISRSLRMGAVFLVLLVPTEYQPNTSYLAHYIGFVVGLVVGGSYYFFNKSKLLKAEVWEVKEVSDELTDLDVIALTYPTESDPVI